VTRPCFDFQRQACHRQKIKRAVVALIEQAMIFALGFLVSGLLALLFLPAFWRRALRLSTRRLEMLMPLSMAEVFAERDQLRAQAAVEIRRAEQKLEAMRKDAAGHLAENGRRAAIIARLETELASLGATLGANELYLRDAWNELGAMHVDSLDLTSRLVQTSADLAALRLAEERLRLAFDEMRIEKAALELEVDRRRIQEDDLRQRLKATQLDSADKAALARKLEDERDFLRKELESVSARRDYLAAAVEGQFARLQELENKEHAERRGRINAEMALTAANQFIAQAQAASPPAPRPDGEPLAEGAASDPAQAIRIDAEHHAAVN